MRLICSKFEIGLCFLGVCNYYFFCNRVFLICPENRKTQIKKTNLNFFVRKICPLDKFRLSAVAVFHFFFVFFVFVETHHKQTVIFAEDKSGTRKYFSPKNGQIKNRQICPGQIRNTPTIKNLNFFIFLAISHKPQRVTVDDKCITVSPGYEGL